MNLFKTGKVSGLSPREQYFDGRLMLIRPLLLIEEKTIATAARQWKFPVTSTSCPSSHANQRSQTNSWLKDLTAKDPVLKKNIYNGLRRWQLDETLKIT
jgi:tRNA(Ile)-lysidine synthase TilS/MesJ